jgi:hypothetical protein
LSTVGIRDTEIEGRAECADRGRRLELPGSWNARALFIAKQAISHAVVTGTPDDAVD